MWYLNREVVRSRAAGGESTRIQPAESETAVEET
jgi:hypothetical protein